MAQMRTAVTPQEAGRIAEWVEGLTLPFTLTVSEGKVRGMSQNALFHAWMGQIGKATHDTQGSVKADCHIQWGIPIFRGHDPAYNDFIVSALGGRPRKEVKEMIERGFVPCTRIMKPKILSEYMATVWREYSPHVRLMDPEARKYEGVMA